MTSKTLSPKTAHKNYMGRMLGASGGYIGTVFAAAFVIDDGDPVSVITILVSLLPAIFVLLMIRAVWRYISEVDEVARHDYVQAMMAALFIVLALSGSWGLVELFNDDLPRVPIFWVFPIFFFAFGIVSSFRYRRCA